MARTELRPLTRDDLPPLQRFEREICGGWFTVGEDSDATRAAQGPRRSRRRDGWRPLEAGTTYAPGAQFAPWKLRNVSALFQGYHPVRHLDVCAAPEAPAEEPSAIQEWTVTH